MASDRESGSRHDLDAQQEEADPGQSKHQAGGLAGATAKLT